MHRFIIETGAKIGDIMALSREEAHHAIDVLRIKSGECVALVDGNHAYEGSVIEANRSVTVRIEREVPGNDSPISITLYQGIARSEKMDLIVQKAVEIGVAAFVPVGMSRCIAKINDAEKKITHWERIANSAVKQCGRASRMEIRAPINIAQIPAHELTLIAWEKSETPLKEAIFAAKDIAIVIGSEGGMTNDEVASIDGKVITLGPRILRTETAGLALAAILQFAIGDM